MNDELRREIEQLRRQNTKALKARYRELFDEESRSSNHAHLFRRIVWRLQALSEGDLSQRARDRAAALAVDVDLRVYAPRKFWRELAAASPGARRDPRLPAIGTTLEDVRVPEFDCFVGDRNALERVLIFRLEQEGAT